MNAFPLDPRALSSDVTSEPIRAGFGRGLLAAGEADERVVALCADLTDSTQMHLFKDRFPRRFVQVGVAEQNLVTVASGMARAGKIPFTSSYAAFSPGRNWEQFKTTAALNDQPVTIVGSHAGINVGPDGATHQMLEDIALMRVIPNTRVIAPADSIEAEKATRALAANPGPSYIRLARDATPVFTTADSPFEIGKAYVLRPGTDLSIITTGTMTYQGLLAASILAERGLDAEVIHVPTIKPLDEETILTSIRKTGYAATIEEAQIAGGLGSAVAELATLHCPVPIDRFGMKDRFGESGSPQKLLEVFRLTGPQLAEDIERCLRSRISMAQDAPASTAGVLAQ
jgi:transketolase